MKKLIITILVLAMASVPIFAQIVPLDLGGSANDRSGTKIRDGGIIINANFSYLDGIKADTNDINQLEAALFAAIGDTVDANINPLITDSVVMGSVSLYENSSNVFRIGYPLNGWTISETSIDNVGSVGPRIRGVTSSETIPVFLPSRSSTDAGIGAAKAGDVNIIQGSASSMVFTDDSIKVFDNMYVKDTVYYKNNPNFKAHRVADLDVTTANTWMTVKFDTVIASEGTWGFRLTSDSTGIITDFNGLIHYSGCSHYQWNGVGGTEVKLYLRVTSNGVENRCSQTNQTRTSATGDNGTMRFAGSEYNNHTDTLRLQYYVTNVAMDFEGDPVFDNPIAFTFQAEAATLEE